jgi:hypothetical protein
MGGLRGPTITRIIEEVPYLPEELQMAVANVEDPSALAHLIATPAPSESVYNTRGLLVL